MDTQDVVAVHDDLSPTLDEVAERRRDYLALLPPGSRSPVALMAQRELGRLHEAGRLDAAELVEQSRSLLLRTEKKLLRDHLALLKAHAAARPADIDAVVEALSSAFANGASDIQRAAVDLVAAQPAHVSPDAIDGVLAAAATLPRDLDDRLRSRLGGLGRRAVTAHGAGRRPHHAPARSRLRRSTASRRRSPSCSRSSAPRATTWRLSMSSAWSRPCPARCSRPRRPAAGGLVRGRSVLVRAPQRLGPRHDAGAARGQLRRTCPAPWRSTRSTPATTPCSTAWSSSGWPISRPPCGTVPASGRWRSRRSTTA